MYLYIYDIHGTDGRVEENRRRDGQTNLKRLNSCSVQEYTHMTPIIIIIVKITIRVRISMDLHLFFYYFYRTLETVYQS